ncbi:thioredoxin domain-containing protein [Candidatus Saccharibacteria bacterium]|nr:thioredoxin domain-containing protein [Candidatus Saccharibacteria bacterium]
MSKRFLIILLVCVLGLIGIYAVTSKKDQDKSSKATPSNNLYGSNSKNVTLIEYGDFQCPACGSYYPIIKQLKEKYADDIQFQFRNFPLSQIHPNARFASRAAQAAANQNKFWEMHDLLYEQQDTWSGMGDPSAVFQSYASRLELDIEKYKADIANSQTNEVINADYAEGVKSGVDSTPVFFLQGKKLDTNPQTLDDFSKLIDEAIKETNQ